MIQLPPSLVRRAQVYPDRQAWLQSRTATIGASEVAPILGLSPYRGPWDVWTAKRDGGHLLEEDTAPDEEDPDAADEEDPRTRGQIWEPFVRERLQAALGTAVESPGRPWARPDALVVVHHPTLPWATCSPDGWLEWDGLLSAPELKTDARRGTGWPRSGLELDGAVEELAAAPVRVDYLLQVDWQLEVLDLPAIVRGVLLGSYRLRWYVVRRNRAFGRSLLNAVAAWRERHLVEGAPPDLDASEACVDHMRARIAAMGPGRGTRIATPEEVPILARWGHARASRKDAERVEQQHAARVLEILGPHGVVRLPSGERVERNAAGHLRGVGFLSTRERKRLRVERAAAYPDVVARPPVLDDASLDFSLTA